MQYIRELHVESRVNKKKGKTRKTQGCVLSTCKLLTIEAMQTQGFSHKVFNETTCVMQLMNTLYSFLQELFFLTGFSNGVFNEACAYRGNRPRRSVVKHADSIL
jgi:hypothetical protein